MSRFSKFPAAALILFFASAAFAQDVTLETIMADPDWIGNAPERPYWADDSESVYYVQKRVGEDIRDPFRVSVAGTGPVAVEPGAPQSSNASRRYNDARNAVVWTDDGDVFVRTLPDGAIRQLTRSVDSERDAQFVTGMNAVSYTTSAGFVVHDLATGSVAQLLDLKFADDPDKDEKFDTLRENQRRIYETVVEEARRADVIKEEGRERRVASGIAPPQPLYLGKDLESARQVLSPDARHLLLVTRPAKHKRGKRGIMPNYMTESGYTETTELRPRVGRNGPAPHRVWLVNIATQSVEEVAFNDLPGIDKDPLAKLRDSALAWHVERGADKSEVEKALKAPDLRALEVEEAEWSADASRVALQLHAHDNKDRWIVSIDVADPKPATQHRLSDEAWINYTHNDFGWLTDNRTLWYLSEESGYSQLYTKTIGERRARALTGGTYVVSDPVLTPDGTALVFRANIKHPGTYEIHRVAVAGGDIDTLTDLGGLNDFVLSPDGSHLLVSHSEFDRHADLFHVALDAGTMAKRLTDTVSDAFKAYDWVIPEIVEIPSSHVDRSIYSKLYLPADFDPAKRYPAVMFVHGAGYTQNAHSGWPYYFREFLFHTLLTQRGVVVLDMDYRASKGYGRDWRTAIYRQMGHPELEDFQDGVAWLVENYAVDKDRVGVYGGSYGGFMTFMSMFRDPGLFAAGAALRPVVDWAHYNHGYTSNILNTPLIDPEAYEKSSPIFFADGLENPLLIAAGMQDNNVFFQDSVLLVQRLLELQKQDFELAVYPLDPHGFKHADSWLDEYRRILKLMENHVINP